VDPEVTLGGAAGYQLVGTAGDFTVTDPWGLEAAERAGLDTTREVRFHQGQPYYPRIDCGPPDPGVPPWPWIEPEAEL
jgi:hypothetical protein